MTIEYEYGGVLIYSFQRTSPYVRPGIDPICGWTWLNAHEHDLDGWIPEIELTRPGSHYKLTIKDNTAMKEVGRIIRGK